LNITNQVMHNIIDNFINNEFRTTFSKGPIE
jgi:hypothetical protein